MTSHLICVSSENSWRNCEEVEGLYRGEEEGRELINNDFRIWLIEENYGVLGNDWNVIRI